MLSNKKAIDEEDEWYLALANMCETYHSLPWAGGVLEQDAYTMMVLGSIMGFKGERQKLEDDKLQREANKAKSKARR